MKREEHETTMIQGKQWRNNGRVKAIAKPRTEFLIHSG